MPAKITTRIPIPVIGPSIAYVPLSQGFYALIDIEDVSLAAPHTWCAAQAGRRKSLYYAKTGTARESYLHRLLIGSVEEVDHRNGNGLDNRRGNLRVATRIQQCMNRSVQSNNRLGLKGIKESPAGRFIARIVIGGKDVHLGVFVTKEEATEAYRAKASEVFGEFHRT